MQSLLRSLPMLRQLRHMHEIVTLAANCLPQDGSSGVAQKLCGATECHCASAYTDANCSHAQNDYISNPQYNTQNEAAYADVSVLAQQDWSLTTTLRTDGAQKKKHSGPHRSAPQADTQRMHTSLQVAPVPLTLVRYLYDSMGADKHLTLEMVEHWWPAMSEAVWKYANGGLDTDDPIEEDDPTKREASSARAKKHHDGPAPLTPRPPAKKQRQLEQQSSGASSQSTAWTPSTLHDYFARQSPGSASRVSTGPIELDPPTHDTRPCTIRIDD